jgi:hypothetical protein
MKKLMLLAAAFSVTAANAVVLDDFSDGDAGIVLNAGAAFDFKAASVPGGTRGLYLGIVDNPRNQVGEIYVAGGKFTESAGVRVKTMSQIGYGFEDDGMGGFITDDMNLNLTGYTDFVFNFDSNDLDLTMNVYVISGGNAFMSSKLVAGGRNETPFVETFSFAGFGGANFGDVDQIVVEFFNSAGGDFALDSFEVVPEPASIAAVGLGLAALARRRRK